MKYAKYLIGVSNDGCCRDEGVEKELFIAFLRLARYPREDGIGRIDSCEEDIFISWLRVSKGLLIDAVGAGGTVSPEVES